MTEFFQDICIKCTRNSEPTSIRVGSIQSIEIDFNKKELKLWDGSASYYISHKKTEHVIEDLINICMKRTNCQ